MLEVSDGRERVRSILPLPLIVPPVTSGCEAPMRVSMPV
jgi:ABC-type molybdate transport system permease subunit